MRKLNKKQKDLIKKFWEEDKLDSTNVEYYGNLVELKRLCEDINDYETIYQDIERLINDLYFSEDYI